MWYFAWYGLGRAFIELLRTDSLMLGPIRVSSMLSFIFCIAAVAFTTLMRMKYKKAYAAGLVTDGQIVTVPYLLRGEQVSSVGNENISEDVAQTASVSDESAEASEESAPETEKKEETASVPEKSEPEETTIDEQEKDEHGENH